MASALLYTANKCVHLSLITTTLYEEVGVFGREREGQDMYYSLAPTHPFSASISIQKF